MDSWVEIKVMVPSERLGMFYELLGGFLKNKVAEAVTPNSHGTASRSQLRKTSQSQLRTWTDERLQMWTVDGSREERILSARQLLRELSPKARQFLQYLLGQATIEAPAEEVVQALNLNSTRVLAGHLSSFGSVSKRIGRYQPYEFRVDPDRGTVYFVDPEIAEVFRAAMAPGERH